jgi:hypothetical protein
MGLYAKYCYNQGTRATDRTKAVYTYIFSVDSSNHAWAFCSTSSMLPCSCSHGKYRIQLIYFNKKFYCFRTTEYSCYDHPAIYFCACKPHEEFDFKWCPWLLDQLCSGKPDRAMEEHLVYADLAEYGRKGGLLPHRLFTV